MAAGLGFKDFTTGEVLTAADVDGYLMQGVWVFASAAARDAAVTSPQEGNFAYLKDTNVTTYYTGSAWANLDTTGMTNPMTTTGDTIYSSSGSTPARLGIGSTGQVLTVAGGVPTWAAPAGGGKVLQVIQATSTTATNIASTSFTDTNLSATITPTLATSKILVMFTQTARVRITTEQATGAGYQLLRGATVVFKPAGAGWEALYLQDNGANTKVLGGIISGSYLDDPNTTSATTYKTQSRLLQTAGSASVDFQENTTNTVGTMILMEIGA